MKILVIGSGGREHALVWKLRQSPHVAQIFCAPGNAGIAADAKCIDIAADDVPALLAFAVKEKIDLTVVGPEKSLTLGIVDTFKRSGLKIFGPSKEAAILESSKAFSKAFCQRYGIPTAKAGIFRDVESAVHFIDQQRTPLVVKADGLASGKGVVVCRDAAGAKRAVEEMIHGKKFGEAGKCVVIEERLYGEEVSFLAISDGNHVLPLASSQDHKALLDDDLGPNTGGMGAYSPAPVVVNGLFDKIMERVMLPTIRGMVTEGRVFTGVLYAGLMIAEGEPYVLEYNVRFGDPETQPLLCRLKNDLVDILMASMKGNLETIHLEWDPRPAVCVVMTSAGYPDDVQRDKVIEGLKDVALLQDVQVFHAGTANRDGKCVTDGGRVLGVTALGNDIREAIDRSYAAVEKVSWEGCHYRRDIGKRALKEQS